MGEGRMGGGEDGGRGGWGEGRMGGGEDGGRGEGRMVGGGRGGGGGGEEERGRGERRGEGRMEEEMKERERGERRGEDSSFSSCPFCWIISTNNRWPARPTAKAPRHQIVHKVLAVTSHIVVPLFGLTPFYYH
jgi:hypothetical protein